MSWREVEEHPNSSWEHTIYYGERPKKGQLIKADCGYDEVDGVAVIYNVKYIGGRDHKKSEMDLHFPHSGLRLCLDFYYFPRERMFYTTRENTHLELINPD